MPASTSTSSPEATASASPSTAATMAGVEGRADGGGDLHQAEVDAGRLQPPGEQFLQAQRDRFGRCSSTAGAGQLLDEQRDALGMPDDHGAPVVGKAVAGREVVDQPVCGRPVERCEPEDGGVRPPGDDGVVPGGGHGQDARRPPLDDPARAGRGWTGRPSAGPRRRTGAASPGYRRQPVDQPCRGSRRGTALGSSSGAGYSAVAADPERAGRGTGTSRPGSSPTERSWSMSQRSRPAASDTLSSIRSNNRAIGQSETSA